MSKLIQSNKQETEHGTAKPSESNREDGSNCMETEHSPAGTVSSVQTNLIMNYELTERSPTQRTETTGRLYIVQQDEFSPDENEGLSGGRAEPHSFKAELVTECIARTTQTELIQAQLRN